MTIPTSGYPCPACRTPADLSAGCPGCGRGPDQVAAEVIRLDREIALLTGRTEQARQAYLTLAASLRSMQERRAELAARVRASLAVPVGARPGHPGPVVPAQPVAPPGVPVAPVPVAGPPLPRVAAAVPPAAPGGPETSTRTVQNLLFVLGGLLLGAALVVFTVVTWSAMGIAGRAAILASLTVLALVVPLVAVRRRLTGTAETFAAVGLLLVLLDGYAAWSVDLLGVTGLPGTRFAALAGGASAAIAAGYGVLSRLRVPWFTALLVAQPVLPLLVAEAAPDAAGWALALAGVALVDLAVAAVLRRRTGRSVAAGEIIAWIGYGSALFFSGVCGVVALALGDAGGSWLLAGGPLLLVALCLAAGAAVVRSTVFGAIAAGTVVVVLALAVLRPVGQRHHSVLLVVAAAVAVALAGLVVVVARLLPSGLRSGLRVGALVVAGAVGQVAVLLTAALAARTVGRSLPPWQGAAAGPDLPFGWQVPVAVLLVTGAVAMLLPHRFRLDAGTVGTALTVLAVPAALPTPWPVVVVLESAVAVLLLLAAVFRPHRSGGRPVLRAVAGALLGGHALLVGLAEPVATVLVLLLVILLGPGCALLGRRGGAAQRTVGGVALAVAVLAVPVTVALVLAARDVPVWWQARSAAAAVALLVGVLVAVRRYWPELTWYPTVAVAVAVLATSLAPAWLPGEEEPLAVYAAVGLLLALSGATLLGRTPQPAAGPGPVGPSPTAAVGPSSPVAAAAPLPVASAGAPLRVTAPLLVAAAVVLPVLLVAVTPALLLVLFGPYGWLTDTWAGVPAGVGLTPSDVTPGLPAGVALLLLTLAALLGGRLPGLPAAPGLRAVPLPLGAFAVPVFLAGAGAPWPAVPVVALLVGLAGVLLGALGRVPGAATGGLSTGRGPAGVAITAGAVLTGAGLAGLLATRASTLLGLGTVVVVTALVGAAGRSPLVRSAGWLAATGSALVLALTASYAGGLPSGTAAFAVLAVAVAALAGGALLIRRRPDEALVVELAAQATALVALLFTIGALRHAAVLCTLWGAAVALRLLRRGETAGRRRALAVVAAGSELVGAWLLLASGSVALLEAYTVPAAGLALVAGLLALRRRPGLNSWLALGPGLAAALLPSLVSVLVAGDPQPWRRLLLGVAALGVVLLGATRRWQAPVGLGGACLALLAGHELFLGWDRVPRWVFLAVGGLVLIGLATTYERRRRDLTRLASAVGRMN